MTKRFVIGDIHGCFHTMKALIENQLAPSKTDHLFFLGDYIDRGKNSKAVLDYLFSLKQENYNLTLLRGNHEEILLQSFSDANIRETWLHKNGGLATLQSFEAATIFDIPKHYIDIIGETVYYADLDDFILVHAGLNLTLENPFEDKRFMLWTRNTPHNPERINHKRIVHGHTPIPHDQIKKNIQEHSFTINIDGGCCWRDRNNFGNLCALELNSLKIFAQRNID